MWKILILSSLLIVTQAANLDNFLGRVWTLVAFYPTSVYAPICVGSNFNKASHDTDCTCTDGKMATLVEVSYAHENPKSKSQEYPAIDITSPNGITLDVNCTCGILHFNSRFAVQTIDDNYVVIYEKSPNKAHVFADKIPKAEDLSQVLQNIEELKNKQGAIICASEVLTWDKKE